MARWVCTELTSCGVPHFTDPIGNIVVGVESKTAYRAKVRQRSKSLIRFFIAHMDHPGFHGVRWLANRRLLVRWHGGAPVRYLRGARVWLAAEGEEEIAGRVATVTLNPSRRILDTAEVVCGSWPSVRQRPAAADLFGAFQFHAPVWQDGTRLYTRVADDLVGVYAIVESAKTFFRSRNNPQGTDFLALISRAEEVGFVGAIGHFNLGWLQSATRPVIVVSLEASRTLPGARVGEGPVVRLGDRRTVFTPDALQALTALAEKKLPGQHQRRVMEGGTCEGTAAMAFGFPVMALSVPLGNYHNQGFEGGPDGVKLNGPAPEYVDIRDVERMIKLCESIMTPAFDLSDPWLGTRHRLLKNYRKYQSLLD